MIGIIKKTVFVFIVVVALGWSAWGGWFQFEPNIVLSDGATVAQDLKDIEKENDYITKGDIGAKQLVEDMKVFIVKAKNGRLPVEYVSYKEYNGSLFVRVKYESGTKTCLTFFVKSKTGRKGMSLNWIWTKGNLGHYQM